VHPYLAQAVAEERIADFLRAAESNRKARDGAQLSNRSRHGSRRRRLFGRQPSHMSARLVLAHSGAAGTGQDRSAQLCEAGC